MSARRQQAAFVLAILLAAGASPSASAQGSVAPYAVVGDAIPASLTGRPGDAARGRRIVASRDKGLCLLCHSGPLPEVRLQGTIATSLAGAGKQASEGQLRLRIVDASRVNAATVMPSFHRIDGLVRVAPAFRGRPILTADEVEDVVAYLVTLKD